MTTERLLSVNDAANLLGVSPEYVRRAARSRRLPHVKVGHYLRFHRTDLLAYIEANTVAVVSA